MKFTKWREFAELVGMAAIVASLIFVGLELRQSHVIATNEIRLATASANFEARNAVNEHAEIWDRGVAGESLEKPDQRVFNNLVDNYYRTAFWNWYTRNEIGVPANRAVRTFALFLHRRPGAMRAWKAEIEERRKYDHQVDTDVRRGYTEPYEFPALVEAELDRLDSMTNGPR